MSDNYTHFSFSFTENEKTVNCSFTVEEKPVTWIEVADKFFKFLSAAYEYDITAKDVVDADSSNS